MRALLSVIGLVVGVGVTMDVSGAQAQAPLTGNDSGGIIAWSCENEAAAPDLAAAHCAWYGKYHRITGVHRQDGDYISFHCLWDMRLARYAVPAVRTRSACAAQARPHVQVPY